MSAAAYLTFAVVLTVSQLKCGDAINLAHHTTIEFKCTTNGDRTPDWFVNGKVAVTTGGSYRSRTSNGRGITTTLTIDGNGTQVTWNIYCEVYEEHQFVRVHSTAVMFQGFLASPENISINNSTIEWKPPYSSVNNNTVHVDPHIIQYTVYITDNYTGNIIVKENVTETKYTFNIDDDLCPTCQVSAWNAGGEGEMSEPVQYSTPQVPRNIIVGSITVRGTVIPNVVHICINNVDVVCTSRIPEFFLTSLMTSGGNVLNETTQHPQGHTQADFTISLPQSVDVCTLHVRISAGNSAGMSAPSEAIEVDCSGDSTDSTTASATTVLTATSTGSGSEGNREQGVSTTVIAVIAGVIAAVVVGIVIAVATVRIICYRKHKRRDSKVDSSDKTDKTDESKSFSPEPPVGNYYTKRPGQFGVVEVVYATTQQTKSSSVEAENTRKSDTATNSLSTSSEKSGQSGEQSLPPSPPAPVGSPHLVYAQPIVKQTQVHPPSNDDHVQYSQIKHQD